MRQQKSLAVLLLTTLALVGCGDDDSTNSTNDGGSDTGTIEGDGGTSSDGGEPGPDFSLPDGGPPTAIALEDLPRAVAEALCNDTCPSLTVGDTLPADLLVQGDAADCASRLATSLTTAFASGKFVTANPAATYDAEAARTCIDRITSTPCASRFELFGRDFCGGDVFTTTATVGDPCDPAGIDECPANAYCRTLGGQNSCGGACSETLAPGEDCSTNLGGCQTGSACAFDPSTETLRCRSKSVAPTRAALGERCGDVISGTTISKVFCAPELLCQSAVSGGTCVAAQDEGELCDNESTFCRPPYECVEGTCAARVYTTEMNARCGIVSGLAAPCDALLGLGCVRESESTESYVCRAAGDGSEGSACLPGELSWLAGTACGPGLFCALTPGEGLGVCSPTLENDSLCERDEECASAFCRDDGEGRFCSEPLCLIDS
jgi:hypothetical protein